MGRTPRRTRTKHQFSPEFLERYRVDRVIGTGGTSVVYRAHQRGLGRDVALKVLDAVGFDESDAVGRFEDEAKLAARLEHSSLCRLYEYGVDNGSRYLAYEYVSGTDLARMISDAQDTPRGGLEPEVALRILGDIALGLEYAHKLGVVHRDLKPANILVDEEGRARVTDFGLAKMAGMTREIRTETGMVVGTPECMAPEQAMGKEVGPPADIYALGCLLFWMLAGRPPFEDPSAGKVMISHVREKFPDLRERRPNLGEGLYRLLESLVERRPKDRPGATELLRALKVLERPGGSRGSGVQQALSSRRIKLVAPAPRRGRRIAGVVAGVLVVLLVWALRPRALPQNVHVRLGADRARVEWSDAPAVVLLRPGDGSAGWERQEGVLEGEQWGADFGELRPGDTYLWRFESEGEDVRREVTTPQAVEVAGPWPRYDERATAVGWLLRPEGDVELLVAGTRASRRGDGLAEVGAGQILVEYPEGLAVPGQELPRPPDLQQGLAELEKALGQLNERLVIGAARQARSKGEIPTVAARRAADELYARWKGIEPAMPAAVSMEGHRARHACRRRAAQAGRAAAPLLAPRQGRRGRSGAAQRGIPAGLRRGRAPGALPGGVHDVPPPTLEPRGRAPARHPRGVREPGGALGRSAARGEAPRGAG
jgi:serine/threonine-protein kinase